MNYYDFDQLRNFYYFYVFQKLRNVIYYFIFEEMGNCVRNMSNFFFVVCFDFWSSYDLFDIYLVQEEYRCSLEICKEIYFFIQR